MYSQKVKEESKNITISNSIIGTVNYFILKSKMLKNKSGSGVIITEEDSKRFGKKTIVEFITFSNGLRIKEHKKTFKNCIAKRIIAKFKNYNTIKHSKRMYNKKGFISINQLNKKINCFHNWEF